MPLPAVSVIANPLPMDHPVPHALPSRSRSRSSSSSSSSLVVVVVGVGVGVLIHPSVSDPGRYRAGTSGQASAW